MFTRASWSRRKRDRKTSSRGRVIRTRWAESGAVLLARGRSQATPSGSIPLRAAHPRHYSVTQGCIYAERCRLADDRRRREAPPPYRVSAAQRRTDVALLHWPERDRVAARKRASVARDHRAMSGNELRALVLVAENLSKTGHWWRVAVDNVSLDLAAGETLGLTANPAVRDDASG